ncbi:hypothetical protein [Magnetofaba australis]|uniref:Uncharacterized protein n=1 Tax=Magnetofaba australis IT-1 TaxID=1434232 RepID=A0A1Y2K034_9PROT|nr:hypothetical protein [Magnetofaba australis]OSM01390.1 hypothetical protein MAIT1_01331 [Magnetofaba australis IT-1]
MTEHPDTSLSPAAKRREAERIIQRRAFSGPNKRKGPDLYVKIQRWLNVVSLGIVLGVLVLIDQARPAYDNLFSRAAEVYDLRRGWDHHMLGAALGLTILVIIFSLFTLFLSSRRKRRKMDQWNVGGLVYLTLGVLLLIYQNSLF